MAGIVTKLTEAPVQATGGGGDQGALVLGSNPWYVAGSPAVNTPAVSSAPTVMQASPNFTNFLAGTVADPVVFEADARPASAQRAVHGIFGRGNTNGTGVYGDGGTGVYGASLIAGGIGVQANGDYGVWAAGNTAGIYATSQNGNAVRGEVPSFSTLNTIAIYGLNNSKYAGPSPGAGGFGVYGLCAKGHGLVGATATAGGAAVVGATNGVAGAYAAAFYGSVVVGGAFTVVGGPKSAAVAHPDGSHRRLYCMESPECWFEDFGTGRLKGGCADVAIDPDFAVMVDLSSYHVFLTQYDAHDVLAVSDRTVTGFRVHANNPDASGEFSFRVVARRNDIAAPRFEQVTIPPEPTLPPLPDDTPVPTLASRR